MAHRLITFTNAADATYRNLYTLMLAVTGAVPTDGILVDRVQSLKITVSGNALLGDSNFTNSAGVAVTTTNPYILTAFRNTICLRDYWFSGSGIVVNVDINSI